MPQSLACLHIHLVFSTKDRRPFLKDELREEIHAYMITIMNQLGCPVTIMNSRPDHVHILFNLSRTLSLAQVVENVKKSSSAWIKTKGLEFSKFSWQAGYGAFSVSESNAGQVAHYIRNQEQHHQKMPFEMEYRELFLKHRIELDERYGWD